MYKCIPYSGGVDVSVNRSAFFTFRRATHNLTDSGNNLVRVSRKIDGLIELLDTPVTDFVDVNSVAVATNYVDLLEYFTKDRTVLAGEGVSVNDGTVSIVSGGPSTLGGFKVGTGLTVDGSGRLSASATSEITRVLNTEAQMLELPTEDLRSYRVIRLDTKRLYYLNASTSPSVLANWFVGPSIEAAVLSFNGRTGAVEGEFGDYNFDLIPMVDKTNATNFTLVVDDGKLYIQNMTSSDRVEISYATNVNDLTARTTALEDLVSSPTGLNVKFTDLETEVARNTDTLYNTSSGLQNRVIALENGSGSGTDHSAEISALQAKDVQQDTLILQVDAKADSVASNNVILDQRVSTLENRPSGTDYSSQISALQSKDVTQDTRLSATEASLLTKASLLNGKVPYDQLPEFPVGRKVNVANQAARLALSTYTDLTIAYQSDTGDAWGLDANADPAISSNWSKLGNAQALGVSSFNGRTGNIGPMTGDYNTGQVTELLDKRFVTQDQITDWDSKETTTGSQTKATVVKDYADSTFLTKSSRGANNGVAPLASDGKVPLENLPSVIGTGEWVIPSTDYVDVKASRVAGTWYLNNLDYDKRVQVLTNNVVGVNPSYIEVRNNITNQIYKLDSMTVGGGGGNVVASQKIVALVPAGFSYRLTLVSGRVVDTWLELNQMAGSTFTPVSQKGIANGVAPLDNAGKVPVVNLPTINPRTWKDVKDSRLYNTWIKNNTSSEMDVFVRTNAINDAAQYLTIQMRANSTSTTMSFQSTFVTTTGARYLQFSGVVPIGWDYAVSIQTGSSSIANIGIWRELSA